MGKTTETVRDVKNDVKEGARDLDGHQPIDDVRNAADRAKTGVDNAVDRAQDVIDDVGDKARETA